MSAESRNAVGARRDALVIALVSCAVLIFEIGVTRLLSVVLWYHFAFLAISLAMLALGAPGVWFSFRLPRHGMLRRCLLGGGVAIPVAISLVAKIGEWSPRALGLLEAVGIDWTLADFKVGMTVLILLIPFLLMGSVVCLLLMRARGARVGWIYAADLSGAALGAALVVPLLHWFPTPHLLAGLGLLPVIAGWLLQPRRPGAPLGLAAVTAFTLAWGSPYEVRAGKVYDEDGLERLYEKWTPTARLTVFRGIFWKQAPELAFGWGTGSRFEPRVLDQLWIEQDASAGTPITRYSGRDEETDHLFFDVTSVGYQLRPPERVCIVGAGGGRDILTALRAGASHVDAVELNPQMIAAVSEVFGEFSGDVYHLPGVNAVVSEGRSFLTGAPEQYDLIQISLIDSWAATAAGAYSLSENYLYTVESMRLYWNALSGDGIVSISRWMRGQNQMESVRLSLLALEALRQEGIEDPLDHLAVLQGGYVATLLMSHRPFDTRASSRLASVVEERGFVQHWPPPPKPPENSMVIKVLTDGPSEFEALGLYLAPPTDDRPFFFQSVRAFADVRPRLLEKISLNDQAARLPRYLILYVSGLTLLLFFSPFLQARRLDRQPFFWHGSSYFLAIGLAFMFVEMSFLQKFVLYLGHPSYATTVVLSSILVGAGLGSAMAARANRCLVSRARWVLPVIVVLVNLGLTPIAESTLGWSIATRIGVSLLLMVPLGFFLGFPFPMGMICFGEGNRAWFWAMNGAAGVSATVSAVALAAYMGFGGVIWLGVVGYLAGCALLPGARAVSAR